MHVGGHHVPDLNLNIFSNLSRGPKDGLTTFGSGVQEIALAWVLQQPGITSPIVGVTKLEQLDQLVGALAVKLDHSELNVLSDAYRPHEVVSELPRPK